MKNTSASLIRNILQERMLSKTKMYSPPLSKKEIADVKKALKSKGKIYKTPEELIKDLHSDVANRQKTSV
ncbi:MAG: hypothetical protein KGH88_06575 [Thaumarchaeota archaeon]|nr:hypothetical protein [Nitrososphaerota archaeon]